MNEKASNIAALSGAASDILACLGSLTAIPIPEIGRMPDLIDPAAVRHPPVRHPGRMAGSFFSRKNGCRIQWESSLERDALRLLEWHPFVPRFSAQPFKLAYTWNGTNRFYTPDILVTTGTDLVIEVKPFVKTSSPEFRHWAAVIAEACLAQGQRFLVWTEREIRMQPRLANIHYLLNCRRHKVSTELFAAIDDAVAKAPGLLFGGLLQGLGGGHDVERAILAAMGTHRLKYDIDTEWRRTPLFPGVTR